MKKLLALPFLAIILLSGCISHLSQQECVTEDWKNTGFADSSRGHTLRDISSITNDCSKFGITIGARKMKDYQAGWNLGRDKYCTNVDAAYNLGSNGRPYPDMCPPQNYAAFKSAYDRGESAYQLEVTQEQLQATQEELRRTNQKLDNLNAQLNER